MGAPKPIEESGLERFVLRRKILQRQKEERKYAHIGVKLVYYEKLQALAQETGYSIREIAQMALEAYLNRVTVE